MGTDHFRFVPLLDAVSMLKWQ